MTSEISPRVAVIDADRRVQGALAEVLRVAGAEIVGTAGDPAAALELIEHANPDVIVIDPRLPDVEAGLALVSRTRADHPALRVIVMGWADNGEVGIPPGTAAYIAKSAQPEEFVAATLAACTA